MKSFLLTAALALVSFGSLKAQDKALWENFPPTYKWDVGFNYGASVITRPAGVANGYNGNSTHIVPDYSLNVQYDANPHWHFIFDVGMRKWESYGTWSNPYLMGTSLKSENVSFLIGKPAVTENFKVNYAIPFYTKFQEDYCADLDFGISAGLVQTVNDGSVGYSNYNANPDSSYRYVSSVHYGFGIGYSFGAQVSYTYYFFNRLGVTAEIAARYVDIGVDQRDGINYLHDYVSRYHMLFFPETIGVRYRFR